jgi:hypothetical protein
MANPIASRHGGRHTQGHSHSRGPLSYNCGGGQDTRHRSYADTRPSRGTSRPIRARGGYAERPRGARGSRPGAAPPSRPTGSGYAERPRARAGDNTRSGGRGRQHHSPVQDFDYEEGNRPHSQGPRGRRHRSPVQDFDYVEGNRPHSQGPTIRSQDRRQTPTADDPPVVSGALGESLNTVLNYLTTLSARDPNAPPQLRQEIENLRGLTRNQQQGRVEPQGADPLVSQVVKIVYRYVQLAHHAKNWSQLPTSLQERISKLASDVKPPMPDSSTDDRIRTLSDSYGTQLRKVVVDHLERQTAKVIGQLHELPSSRAEQARVVVQKQLHKRYGRKMANDEVDKLIAEAVGKLAPTATVIDSGQNITDPNPNLNPNPNLGDGPSDLGVDLGPPEPAWQLVPPRRTGGQFKPPP